MKYVGYGSSEYIQMDKKWVTNSHWAFKRSFFETNYRFKSRRLNKLLLAGEIICVRKGEPIDHSEHIRDINGMITRELGEKLTLIGRDIDIDKWGTRKGTKIDTNPIYYDEIIKDYELRVSGLSLCLNLIENGSRIGVIMGMR